MTGIVSDFSKTPSEIILDLINQVNSSNLTDALVTLGIPTVTTTSGATWNTDLTVTSKTGSGYSGSVVVNYNRLDVQGFLFGNALSIPLGDKLKLSDCIPEINAALHVNITADDYIDATITDTAGAWEGTPNETKTIVMQMNPDSLVFIGTLTFTIHSNDIPLGSVITTPTLTGLNYPAQS